MKSNDPNIKAMIKRESGRRRDKRIRIGLSDEEYEQLLTMSFEKDMSMADLIRKLVFKEL